MKQKFVGSGDLAIDPKAVGLTYPRAPRDDQMRAGVAVIRVCGPLEHRGGFWFDSYDSLLGRVEGAFQHEDVQAVILDIDSPGGEVSGLQETVRKIRLMRAHYDKPIVAYANDEAYSAAYAIACSCDEIYMPEGGGVGSIGVLAELQDMTAMAEKQGVRVEVVRSGMRKAEGHPFIPMTDSTILHVQQRVDGLAKQFFSLVADVRPMSKKDIAALQGQCVYGKRAVNAGLADGIASFDEVLSSLSKGRFDNDPDSVVSFTPNDRSVAGEGTEAMSFAVLQKKVAVAAAALEAAKTPAARKRAMAAYAAAAEALAEARAKAKVKKTYNKKTTEEETEEDDGEEDDEDDDDDDDDDDDSSSSAAADEDSEEDEEEAEDEKKMKKSKKALKSTASIATFVKSLTGQSSAASAKQMLVSMHEQAQQNAINAAEIAKLKDAALASERKSVITSMMAAGQLKPAQLAWAETQPIKSLKAYAKATPAMFQPRAPQMLGASDAVPDTDGLTAVERDIVKKTGISVDLYKSQRAAEQGPQLPKVN